MSIVNPVLGREIRERLRSGRSFVALTLFLGLLAGLTWAVVTVTTHTNANNQFNPDLSRLTSSGRTLLDALVVGMTVLMMFLLPGIAAVAVTGERERQTLIPLQISLLRPRSIFLGKVLSAAAYATLMLVAASPMFAAAYMLGGVTVSAAVRTMFGLIVVAIVITTIAVTWSTIAKRTAAAVIASYAFTLLLCVGAPVLYQVFSVVTEHTTATGEVVSDPNNKTILLANPLVAVALFQDTTAADNGGLMGNVRRAVRYRGFDPGKNQDRLERNVKGVPDWIVSFGVLGAFTAGAGVIGTRRLRTPTKSER
jgi:ABC-type transport system involved in multi-copper enzyme maturation permease subunit